MTLNKRVLMMTNHFISLYLFRKELIKRLLDEGFEVYLSIPHDERNEYFRNLGCTVIEAPIDRRGANPLRDAVLCVRYAAYMRSVKPCCALSYTAKPNIYGAFAAHLTHTKQICNITGTGATFLHENVLSKILRTLYRVGVKHADTVFFQNASDREYFMRHAMAPDYCEIISGSGVNLTEHCAWEYPPTDTLCFLFSSRIYAIKGVDEFLECARVIKERHKNVKFVAAGALEDAGCGAKMEEYDKRGIIEYIGFQDDIKACLRECHCVVLPSRGGEGVPNSLLEAAATARCIIASNVPGCNDVVEDGVNGFLFKAGDAADFIEKTEKFIALSHEEKRRMGRLGRERAERLFDRNIVINKYLEKIYEYSATEGR